MTKAKHTGFLEGVHWSDFVLSGSPDGKTRRLTRALVTAFLMHQLLDEDRVEVLVDGKVSGTTLVRPLTAVGPAGSVRGSSAIAHPALVVDAVAAGAAQLAPPRLGSTRSADRSAAGRSGTQLARPSRPARPARGAAAPARSAHS